MMPDLPLNLAALHDPQARRAYTLHSRAWQSNRYVYPVVSRRSKGISIGINLNPDKICNFDCIYCSVERHAPLVPNSAIDLALLHSELMTMLDVVRSGDIYSLDPFDKIPPALRRLNDIAFSGDGEPTTCPQFHEACQLAAELKATANLPDVKLVLITNATMFHRSAVQDTLAVLDKHNGEIWAKLDAGTEAYYDLVDRTPVPFQRVLDNILWCACMRPTVIQSLFMKIHDAPPPPAEIVAYVGRLAHILSNGGQIKLVQLYTVARQTTEVYAAPLLLQQLETFRAEVISALPAIAIEIYA